MRSNTKNRVGKNPEYLAWLHTLPCFICSRFGLEQTGPSRSCHIGERGLSQKCPDTEAVPACDLHHTESPYSLHKAGKRFWELWAIDKAQLLAEYQKLFLERAA